MFQKIFYEKDISSHPRTQHILKKLNDLKYNAKQKEINLAELQNGVP